MSNNVNNVSVGKPKPGGSAFIAAAGTTPPVNAVSELSEDFKGLGYISDDGVKNNGERSVNKIKAWGGDVVASAQTEKTDTFTVTFIESLNDNVMKMVYGKDNVSGSLAEGMTVLVNSSELDEWVKRLVIPKAKVDSVSEITYDDENVIGYQCEITALPDTSGNTHYEYFKSTESSGVPDTTLTSLVIEGVTLTPAFIPTITSYRASTSDTSNAITASASDGSATISIKVNDTDTIENGQPYQWHAGANPVVINVSKGGYRKTYNVTVTKTS